MLNTLAKKYEINQSEMDWKVKLFNKLCLIMDAEKQIEKEQAYSQEIIEKLKSKLNEKLIIESFLIKTATRKDNPTFRGKLKKAMNAEGLSLDMNGDNPSINVTRHQNYQPKRRQKL